MYFITESLYFLIPSLCLHFPSSLCFSNQQLVLCAYENFFSVCSYYGKQYKVSSKTLNIELPYDPTIPLLGIQRNLHTNLKIYIDAYVHCSIAKTWKQNRCPLKHEWIKKSWYIYAVDHESHKKRKIKQGWTQRVLC